MFGPKYKEGEGVSMVLQWVGRGQILKVLDEHRNSVWTLV